MVTSLVQLIRRPVTAIASVCLLVLLSAIAACGGSGAAPTTSSTTNAASSGPKPVMTLMIKESKDGSGNDVYVFDRTTITLKKGDVVAFQNLSDELQDVDAGDASKAGIDVKVLVNQSATATFNVVGTFAIKSNKGAALVVTVN